MRTDQDRFLKLTVQALHDWSVSLGEFAWVFVGVLMLVGIAAMLWFLRWIWGGGLSRQSGFGLFRQR
jgi:hypothetical protein